MSDDVSRRWFVKAFLAGTVSSLLIESRPAAQQENVGPTELTLREVGELVRRKKISPVDVTKACLARIEQLNPTLNAFITITAESALLDARTAETEIQRGRWRGPLHGIPIALKDLFDTAGVRTTAGSALFTDRVPSDDAEVVRRLKAAGAVLVGLKPTSGLVSNRGVIPLSWSLDHVGPMSRTVADAALMLQVIAGYDPEEPTSMQIPVVDYAAALRMRPSTLRIGVARDFFFAGLDPEIETAVSKALAVLEGLTGGLRDVAIPANTQEQLRATVRAAEAYAYHAEFVAKSPELYQPETLARIRTGADITTSTYIQARRELAKTRRTIGQVFQMVDVLVTPTTPIPPQAVADFSTNMTTSIQKETLSIRNTSPFDVYGWPTISIPCGFTVSGLPIGLQVSGPVGSDAVVLQVAHAYEQATAWHTKRP